MNTALATGAIPMLRNFQAKCIGAQVRDLAEEFNGGFRIAVFKFAHRGAHAAERLKLASRADCLTVRLDSRISCKRPSQPCLKIPSLADWSRPDARGRRSSSFL